MLSSPLVLTLPPSIQLSDDQFFELCQINHDLRLERNLKTGEIWIMTPAGGETGNRNFSLIVQLGSWVKQDKTGIGFDSSTGFRILGATKDPMSPDAAWVRLERWNALTPEQQQKFPPICPDFVVELRSPSDTLKSLQKKMEEWVRLGVQLGWLIDRTGRQVYIYRQDGSQDCLENPETLSGEMVLPGFVLDMSEIW
ncbi:MAG: Uma2 family endonuclease [Coleofasciculus sp. D1-CHI-01]|uniref:Uma2 family endonuclease n=1 Tax=Coleofasciculus sp. D1-CHI-01 TaxID=3068482 RepID=UPI0033031084